MSKWISGGVEFKTGDKVVVSRLGEPCTMGDKEWNNVWVEEMNSVGVDYLYIDFIDEEGVHFAHADNDFGPLAYAYPLSALENITAWKMQMPKGSVEVFA